MLGIHWQLLMAITAISVVFAIVVILLVGISSQGKGCEKSLPTPRSPRVIALLAFVAFAIYGSWVPFQFQSISWHEALIALRQVPEVQISSLGGSDWVANILLLVPIGFFAVGTAAVRYRSWKNIAAFAMVMFACVLFSVALEVSQLWFPPRIPSQRDILAQTIGASIGGLLWLLCGEQAAAWTHAFAASRRSKEQLDWILECYAIGLLLFSIFPLDLTMSLTQIIEKYRAGRIELVPAWTADTFTVQGIYQIFKDIVFFVPIGMLTATWRTLPHQPVRNVWVATFWGVVFAAAIEFAQLLIVSRYTSVADIMLGTCGVGLGVGIMYRWKGTYRPISFTHSYRRGALWLGLALTYSGLLLLAACLPVDRWITDMAEIKRRYLILYEVPMTALYWGDPFHALGQVTQKLLFFAPLGLMCCQAAYAISDRRVVRRWLLVGLLGATFAVAVAMEVIQVFLPDRYPTLTDAALRTFGAAIAMFVTARFLRREVSPIPNSAK